MKKFLLIFFITVGLNILNADEFEEKNEILISAENAVKLIGKPDVMFVSAEEQETYENAHIQGSVNFNVNNLNNYDSNCPALLECIEKASKHIGEKGIDNNTLIIVYGNDPAYLYYYFKSYGHSKLKILNAELKDIKKLDPSQKIYDSINLELQSGQNSNDIYSRLRDVETNLLVTNSEENCNIPKIYEINKNNLDFTDLANKYEVKNAMQDILKNRDKSKYLIIDTRSFPEIIGDLKLENVARGGHIPASIFIESFKDDENLTLAFEENGILKEKTIYAYGHSGFNKSSSIIMLLKLNGFENIKVYSGGWNEWANDLSLPINK